MSRKTSGEQVTPTTPTITPTTKVSTWTRGSRHGPSASDQLLSFDALQRAVEGLPGGIYRAKGIVRLDLETGDSGILNLTGKRAWLKLVEPDSSEQEPATTELVFIGKPGSTTNDAIADHFRMSLQAAVEGNEPHVVSDIRALQVIFA